LGLPYLELPIAHQVKIVHIEYLLVVEKIKPDTTRIPILSNSLRRSGFELVASSGFINLSLDGCDPVREKLNEG
jgi:hypothetical protein